MRTCRVIIFTLASRPIPPRLRQSSMCRSNHASHIAAKNSPSVMDRAEVMESMWQEMAHMQCSAMHLGLGCVASHLHSDLAAHH